VTASKARPWAVDGNPSDAELAAVVAALTAAASAAGTAAGGTAVGPGPDDTSGWSAYWRGLRGALPSGPGAWTASGYPRS
jgi:hypothetical protein